MKYIARKESFIQISLESPKNLFTNVEVPYRSRISLSEMFVIKRCMWVHEDVL